MEELQYENNEQFMNPQPQRPTGLSIFCVLSFIGGAWNALQNFVLFAAYDGVKKMLNDEDILESYSKILGDQADTMVGMYESLFSVDRIYFILQALLSIGSFIGVLYMWKLQKKGFHIYTIAQILMLIVSATLFYGIVGTKPWGDVLWTVFFVLWYLPFYKKVMR